MLPPARRLLRTITGLGQHAASKLILPDQVLELPLVSSRIRTVREKQPDSGDPCLQVEATGLEGDVTEFE